MIKNNNKTLTYTPFNKTKTISNGLNTTTISYDTNQYRYKKSTTNYDTYYIDKDYEQSDFKNNDTQEKYFIYTNDKVVSIYTNNNINNNTISDTKYLYHDALGSIDTITNNKAKIVQRLAYKPFGEQINFSQDGSILNSSIINRGYTGHENLQEDNLVNMNARLYDPTIGRFLSADTMIPNPYSTQDFNRYTYVLNNPFKYTDPSGHYYIPLSNFHLYENHGFKYYKTYYDKGYAYYNEGEYYYSYLTKRVVYLAPIILYDRENGNTLMYSNFNTVHTLERIRVASHTRISNKKGKRKRETVSSSRSLTGTWNNNRTKQWNQNRETLDNLPNVMGGNGGFNDTQLNNNDKYFMMLSSAALGYGLSGTAIKGLNVGANVLRNNPNGVMNTVEAINGYYKSTPNPNNTIESVSSFIKWVTQ